ncbi:MAG: Sec-independent protein translocase protein TatB [Alphaproteobacteria bacterium]|nr:Sec-independent protein translocase protein TatB [Alphaproteobacteria bacterium]
MFNLGWAEMLLVVVVAVVAIGPRELPTVMRALGRVVRRMQYMRYALSQQFEDFMQEHELDELRRSANYQATNPTTTDAEKDEDENEHEHSGPHNPPAP